MRVEIFLAAAIVSIVTAGCFTPPQAEEPTDTKTSVVVPLPYDLAWTATNQVIRENNFKIQASDPNHGIIEVQGEHFSLQDADCGKIESVGGTYAAQPEANAIAVYNFHVKAVSNESTRVEVQGSFDSALRVPLHPYQDVQCVSRGAGESRILQQILAQARITRPPVYKRQEAPAPGSAPSPEPPVTFVAPSGGRPTLLKPEQLPKAPSE
ncbi:MAG: hypothetical protein ACLQDV_10560 [Candidatus Binataceae bacterium]